MIRCSKPLDRVVDSNQFNDRLKLLPLHGGLPKPRLLCYDSADIDASFTKRKG